MVGEAAAEVVSSPGGVAEPLEEDVVEANNGDLAIPTSPPVVVAICTGNLGRAPGGVATVIPVPGETMRAPSLTTIATS